MTSPAAAEVPAAVPPTPAPADGRDGAAPSPDEEPPTLEQYAAFEADRDRPGHRGLFARLKLRIWRRVGDRIELAPDPTTPPSRPVAPVPAAPAPSPAPPSLAAPRRVAPDGRIPAAELFRLADRLDGAADPEAARDALVDAMCARWRDRKALSRRYFRRAVGTLSPAVVRGLIRDAEEPGVNKPAAIFASGARDEMRAQSAAAQKAGRRDPLA